MYLKNFFKSRKSHVAAVVVPIAAGLTVGLYNLYLLGRCDQISEFISMSENFDKREFTLYDYGHGKKITFSNYKPE